MHPHAHILYIRALPKRASFGDGDINYDDDFGSPLRTLSHSLEVLVPRLRLAQSLQRAA